jgi:hypothetical protein
MPARIRRCCCERRATRGLLLAHDYHVGREQQATQSSTQPHGLVGGIPHFRLDHEKVQVAVPTGLTPRVRPEQDHPGSCRRRLRQPPASLLDHRFIDHMRTVAR